MAVYAVYADVLWLINFVLDGVLLWGTARFGGFVCKNWRLALAAALGALYGVGLLYPALAVLYIMPLPLLFSLLMLLVGFGRMKPVRFATLALYFYLLAFMMGGAALAVRFLLADGFLGGVSLGWLAPALLAAIVPVVFSVGYMRRSLRQSGLTVTVEIDLADKTRCFSCFLDSGNTLREPMSGRPVLLVELSVLREVLPWDFYVELDRGLRRQAGGGEFRPYQLMLQMQGRDFSRRLTLVPYSGVMGGALGLAVLPDRISYRLAEGRKITPSLTPVILPVAGNLQGIGGAHALLSPQAVFGADELSRTDCAAEMNLAYGCDGERRIGA